MSRSRIIEYGWRIGALLLLAAGAGGCSALGYAANAASSGPKDAVPARYHNMVGQTCAVMVYADPGVRTDFPNVRRDIAGSVQNVLEEMAKDSKNSAYLGNVKFPYPAISVVRFQDDNPGLMQLPITDIAPRIGIPGLTRLIYIEVKSFQTRYEKASELFRGSVRVDIYVVRIDGDHARVDFTEQDLVAGFPEKEDEAKPASETASDQYMYTKTIEALTNAASQRFFELQG